MPRSSRSHARAQKQKHTIIPAHHVQARVSDAVRVATAQLAHDRGVSESEIVRDAMEAYLFGSRPGETMEGPDHGYRIAKSTAGVIAKKMLHRAYAAMPETWTEFKRLVEEEGV